MPTFPVMTPELEAKLANPNYPRYVQVANGATEPCYDCDHQEPIWVNGKQVRQPPNPGCPFCSGTGKALRKVLVQNPAQHSGVVGYKVDETGNRWFPKPPTAEEFIKQGIDPAEAEKMADQELLKAAKGYVPYGEVTPPSASAPAPKVEPVVAAPVADKSDPLAEF